MTTTGLAPRIRQLADFADIRGTVADAAGWRRLADALESAGADPLSPDGLEQARPLLSPALYLRLAMLLDQGVDVAYSAALGSLPWTLRRLIELDAADSRIAAALAGEGLVTFPDVDAALRDGRLRQRLPGHEEMLRRGAGELVDERVVIPLGRAVDLLESFAALLAATSSRATHVQAAGDVRRFEPLVEWLALAAAAPDPVAALDTLCLLPQVQPVRHRTSRRALVTYQQAELDVRIAAPDEFGTTLHAATGSHAHLFAMRGRQRVPRLWPREEEVYRHAGLAWIPPELRQDRGELEAAASGALPRLIDRPDIRGDLHIHTIYSDGRDSVAEMVQAAAALGYEYVAITDHSARSFASRTLSLDSLARQRDEIAALRERFPQLVLLHGVEVDIMPDGQLDFADHVLEPLDIVLASLHDRAGHDEARLTRRCLDAIRHPLVNIITHPANRMVGRDRGYDLAFPEIFEAAAAHGTALEIDGAPGHLDLDGEQARAAAAAGVTLVIDSDCHRATLLERQMSLGVGTARRGWVEARQVLNTRPIQDVRAFLAAKRLGVR